MRSDVKTRAFCTKQTVMMLAVLGLTMALFGMPAVAHGQTLQTSEVQAQSSGVVSISVGNSEMHDIYNRTGEGISAYAGVEYNPSTNTLTLNNVKTSDSICIECDGASCFNLILNGINSFEEDAIYVYGDLENLVIGGDGSLSSKRCAINAMTTVNWDSAPRVNITMNSGVIVCANTDCKFPRIQTRGKVVLKGGSKVHAVNNLKASFEEAKCDRSLQYAIYAREGMTNSYENLGAVKGLLPNRAEFKCKGGVWKVGAILDCDLGLVKWFGGKKVDLDHLPSMNGWDNYDVTSICSDAFKTPQGEKVTKIIGSAHLDTIGANAFSGTKCLKTLDLRSWGGSIFKYKWNKKRECYVLTGLKKSLSSKAFSGMGKGKSGSKTRILLGDCQSVKKMRKALLKKGMPKKVKVVGR